MKNKQSKAYTIPAHEHIRLKEEQITYNSDRGLKFKPFADFKLKEKLKHG